MQMKRSGKVAGEHEWIKWLLTCSHKVTERERIGGI